MVASQDSTPKATKPDSKSPMMIVVIVIVIVVLVVLGILSGIAGSVGRMFGTKIAEKSIESASGGQAKVNISGKDVTVQTKEGTYSSGTTLPSDWPQDVPVYAGAKVEYSGSSNGKDGRNGYAAVLTSADPSDKVVEFYKKELAAKGWVVTGTQQASGISVITAEKGVQKVGVSLASENNQTRITIGVSQ